MDLKCRSIQFNICVNLISMRFKKDHRFFSWILNIYVCSCKCKPMMHHESCEEYWETWRVQCLPYLSSDWSTASVPCCDWLSWRDNVITLRPDNIDIGTLWWWWHRPPLGWQSKHFHFKCGIMALLSCNIRSDMLLLNWFSSSSKYIHQLRPVSLGSQEIELSSGGRI